jgi:hypothetical protein
MVRWLFLIHRYLGIGIGVLMLLWCVSGFVMMYVHYPELSARARLRHVQPLDWRACCVVNDSSLADDARIARFRVEKVGTTASLSLEPVAGAPKLIDLADGHVVTGFSESDAQSVALAFEQLARPPRFERLVDRDPWTVSGELNSMRPFYLYALADTAGTQIYVSSVTGKVVQATTARERFWNWLGAIPHWLYFTQLRSDVGLWSQVVIWTSLAGCFLTLIGLYIGARQFLRRPLDKWSPYRGVALWHHLPGLVFGGVLLTWVTSGLFSMNPWGFLDSDAHGGAAKVLRGEPLSGLQVKTALRFLPDLGLRLPDTVAVESAPLWGQLYLAATTTGGARWRFDLTGRSAKISDSTWGQVAQALGGNAGSLHLITAGDAYYFERHDNHILLPAYRVISNDAQRTRYYLDPLTGALLASFDSNARWYRWLHQGLHTLDFTPGLRARPGWDVLMVLLLSGATLIAATGTYLGLRRLT